MVHVNNFFSSLTCGFLLALISAPTCVALDAGAPSTSDTPVAGSSASSPASSNPNKGFFERFRAFPRYVKAVDQIQEIGHWAQDQIGISREEQSDIWLDLDTLYSSSTEAGMVKDGCIIITVQLNQSGVCRGTLVNTLLHEAAHKKCHEKLLTKKVRNSWCLSCMTGATLVAILPSGGIAWTASKIMLGGMATLISKATLFDCTALLPAMETDADTQALAAMHCSACVREAGRGHPESAKWLAECGYLLEHAFIKRAEELEAANEPLCEYHSRLQAQIEKFKSLNP